MTFNIKSNLQVLVGAEAKKEDTTVTLFNYHLIRPLKTKINLHYMYKDTVFTQ
jgi:hypothetical protein